MAQKKKPPRSSRRRRFRFNSYKPVFLAVLAFGVGAGLMLAVSHYPVPVVTTVQSSAPTQYALPRLVVRRAENLRQSGVSESADPTPLLQYEEAMDAGQGESGTPTTLATLPAVVPLPPVAHEEPPAASGGRRLIAVVIDDVGPDRHQAHQAITLPSAVTLAFLPYAETLSEQVAAARAARHQIIVHMPMEPQDMAHNNPGSQALLVTLGAADIRARVGAALQAIEGEVGLNNHMGSRFTASLAAMQPVMEELARRDLFFLDSRTTPQSVGATLARRYGVRYVARDVFLDNVIEGRAIQRQLDELARVADRRGQAVAIGHPHPETLEALRRWIPLMQRRGYNFVPVSELARRLPATDGLAVSR